MRDILLALMGLATAQEPAPTFRTSTRLVEVSLSVKGADGRPVLGLTKADIEVKAGGRERQIAFLQFDGAPEGRREMAPLPRYVFTNRPEYQEAATRNVTAIVIDTLNSTLQDEMRLRAQLLRYLRTLAPGTRVALYQLSSSLRVLHDFTADPEDLRRRINSLALRRLPTGEDDAASLRSDAQALVAALGASAPGLQQTLDRMLAAEQAQAGRIKVERLESAFTAMMALARHLSAVPGRKNLIWAGGGLPLTHVVGGFFGPGSRVDQFESWIQRAARRLAAANVVLYYFDTRGLVAPAPNADSQRPQSISDSARLSADARIGTSVLAKMTGGRYIYTDNSVAAAIEAVEADQSAGYTLAFYSDDAASEAWIPLSIQVRREGAQVRHREGYSAAAEPAAGGAPEEQEERRAALANPLGSDAILMNARCEPDPEGGPGGLRLFVQIDAETLALRREGGVQEGGVEITVADVTAEGRIYAHSETARVRIRDGDWERTVREGIPYMRRWRPRLEAVRVRVLVKEAGSGRVGTLDMPLKGVLP